jgi:hypothetical protein
MLCPPSWKSYRTIPGCRRNSLLPRHSSFLVAPIMHSLLPVPFLVPLLFSITTLTACFLPNGTQSTSPAAQPCSFNTSDPLASTCCNTGWDNPPGGDLLFGQPRDECLPNGLCQNRGMSTIPGKEAATWTHYYRVYCTNKTGEGCVGVCDPGVRDYFLLN